MPSAAIARLMSGYFPKPDFQMGAKRQILPTRQVGRRGRLLNSDSKRAAVVAQTSKAVAGCISILKKHYLDIPDFPSHYSRIQA
jgi:hypothetical protein